MVSVWVSVIIAAAAAIVAGIAGFVSGGLHRKRVAEATIGSAQKEATRIVNEAVSKAESKRSLKPRMKYTSSVPKPKKIFAKDARRSRGRKDV